jgi:glycosyltransferase involved in cell wall biosynthesis
MTAPDVSVVIPCRNEARYIETCLTDLFNQEAIDPDRADGGYEVIVADGMSDDGTREILTRLAKQHPRLRWVDNPERKTPTGLNAGIRSARGRIIIRIDAHTEYAPDYLKRCVETLRETGADNVGGPWVARGKSYLQRAIAVAFGSPFAVGGARGHRADYAGPVDTVYLGCWPREVFERIGLFDEELVRNQDDELNLRLQRAGGKIWQSPTIISWYTPRSSLIDLFRQYWQYGYWKVRVIQKHGTPASLRHLVPGAFVSALVLFALLAPFLRLAFAGFSVLAGLYLIGLLFASAHTALRSGWAYAPVMPVVLPCFHFGYGLGFMFGVWDFIVCRRGSGRFVALTRK